MSNELNNMKVKALKAIYEMTVRCVNAYKQYEQANEDMTITCESIWSSEEDKLMGMRKLYKAMFEENAPRSRSEILNKIKQLS